MKRKSKSTQHREPEIHEGGATMAAEGGLKVGLIQIHALEPIKLGGGETRKRKPSRRAEIADRFIAQCCGGKPPDYSKAVYDEYLNYCRGEGIPSADRYAETAFRDHLKKRRG